jgi:hypothetical protein
VLPFDDLLARTALRYDAAKTALYAHADKFVQVQGGNAHFAAMFGGDQVALHVSGPELASGSYAGWYARMCPDRALRLAVAALAARQ